MPLDKQPGIGVADLSVRAAHPTNHWPLPNDKTFSTLSRHPVASMREGDEVKRVTDAIAPDLIVINF